MIPFWHVYRPWLEARGFRLFEPYTSDLSNGFIFPPPTQCPTALPYAIYADVKLETSIQITPPVSGFDAGDLCLDR